MGNIYFCFIFDYFEVKFIWIFVQRFKVGKVKYEMCSINIVISSKLFLSKFLCIGICKICEISKILIIVYNNYKWY